MTVIAAVEWDSIMLWEYEIDILQGKHCVRIRHSICMSFQFYSLIIDILLASTVTLETKIPGSNAVKLSMEHRRSKSYYF
jgi:hypothetical protein